ncbi:diaminopimelate decarboxylase [Actinorhabdospora filicis]|uniref:Diaminopimelate decarboxylase n=1 Tax=Actinorhabdospora filicis TaxID=1785913 RepID=A0A9W6W7Y7_9ACTN|nr:diaminopimelate decarboxylase [Actinorhabdospora filicis]GLZ75951.1 diaminopimelate decarboxylase [Actinorhabdospora filicis]
MRAHEAGVLHAEAGQAVPSWLREPEDVNLMLPQLWARTVERREDGVVAVGGVPVTEIAAEFGTPAYVLDEDDFRARAREYRDAFAGADVFYAGKSFLCKAVVRWIHEEGLHLDVCTGGELAVALAAGFPPERMGLHGNNKSVTELTRAVEAGVGRIVLDSFDELDRLTAIARELGARPKVMIRTKVGVEAHTHAYIATAHEDQKFGLGLDEAAVMAARVLDEDVLELLGFHSHIGSQIFDASAFEVAARRVLGLQAKIRDERGVELPELDLGGGYGMAYTTQDDPIPVPELAERLRKIMEHECAGYGLSEPRLSVEPGRAICGPTTFTLYEVGTVKQVPLDYGASRAYVSVDGGMSDNIRPALYDASYSATIASRASSAAPVLARVVGKHCESGDIVVKDEFLPADVSPGDLLAVPGTGAYARSMASNYNHVPRPPVLAVADGTVRVIVRRETEDDLLRLDVG